MAPVSRRMAKMNGNQAYSLECDGALPFLFRRIPAGHFLMGSSNGLPIAPEGPEHSVEVNGFWMADSPVTAQQYEAVMKRNPSKFQGHWDLPVESVSWLDVKEFCDTLSQSSGVLIRLPSEAEWEYACRAQVFDAIPFRRFAR